MLMELATTPEETMMTVNEVADYLKISPTTVWRHCSDGTIPAFRVGRQWRIERQDLNGWIETMKKQQKESNR